LPGPFGALLLIHEPIASIGPQVINPTSVALIGEVPRRLGASFDQCGEETRGGQPVRHKDDEEAEDDEYNSENVCEVHGG
jgi:hypothetical protein